MNEQALKLFKENYLNVGLCNNLEKFVKSFEKEFKKSNTTKTISYLPWAVVERIFRMQGGKIEVVEWVNQVEFDFLDMQPDDNGVFTYQNKKEHALFIHIRANWNGEVEDEFYPLFDNQNAKVLKTPDALDLNTAKQRGMVRLIARVSGIGLWIFEQQDTQFGDDGPGEAGEKTSIKVIDKETPAPTPEPTPEPTSEEPNKKRNRKGDDKKKQTSALAEVVKLEEAVPEHFVEPKIVEVVPQEKPQPQQEPKPVKVEEPKQAPKPAGFLKEFLTGAPIETPQEPKQPTVATVKETFGPDTEEYAKALLDVRAKIRLGNLQLKAKDFVKSKGKELLSQLTYDELKELEKTL